MIHCDLCEQHAVFRVRYQEKGRRDYLALALCQPCTEQARNDGDAVLYISTLPKRKPEPAQPSQPCEFCRTPLSYPIYHQWCDDNALSTVCEDCEPMAYAMGYKIVVPITT